MLLERFHGAGGRLRVGHWYALPQDVVNLAFVPFIFCLNQDVGYEFLGEFFLLGCPLAE
jgi:hypothetical protein